MPTKFEIKIFAIGFLVVVILPVLGVVLTALAAYFFGWILALIVAIVYYAWLFSWR